MNIFDRLVQFLDRTEVSGVTFIAKVVPLLVPIIPAYVGYSHVTNKVTGLGFDAWAGWVYGAVIEGLGYAAIYKAVQFWEHNRKYTAEKNQAPLFMAVVIYLVYLVVTLLVNVMLDYKAGVEIYKVVALVGISLLSVPAGLLMSISAIHTERMTERTAEREQAKAVRDQRRTERNRANTERASKTALSPLSRRSQRASTEQLPSAHKEHPFMMQSERESTRQSIIEMVSSIQSAENRTPSTREVARAVGCANSYASTVMKELKESENV